MLFSGKITEEFDVKDITDAAVDKFIKQCATIYKGQPEWAVGNVKTINFARSICQETARLTMLATSIKVEGSERADWLQKKIDAIYPNLRKWVEFGCAYGSVMLKPSEDGVDLYLPDEYIITEQKNGKARSAVFVTTQTNEKQDKWYIRLEYHRFVNDVYLITNRCFVGNTKEDLSTKIDIKNTPWKGLSEEVGINGLEKPLFSLLTMPSANFIDEKSAVGLPIFADAIEELKDLDIAYSRNAEEIFDSERIVLLDADKLLPSKNMQTNTMIQKNTREQMELPKFVRNVMGNGTSDFYQEINPTLNTLVRLEGLNSLLSQIGYKCGFSNGYFVFNEKTGMVTATQIESDDRRTIQFIKDVRDQLEDALKDLIDALSTFADLYEFSPSGEYKLNCNFGDLTYSYQEDKATWWNYVLQGKVPFWRYLVKFEGMTEEEAKEIEDEQKQAQAEAMAIPSLFSDEED